MQHFFGGETEQLVLALRGKVLEGGGKVFVRYAGGGDALAASGMATVILGAEMASKPLDDTFPLLGRGFLFEDFLRWFGEVRAEISQILVVKGVVAARTGFFGHAVHPP